MNQAAEIITKRFLTLQCVHKVSSQLENAITNI